jgi:hypothetical protein
VTGSELSAGDPLGWNGTFRHFPPLDLDGRYRQRTQFLRRLSLSGIPAKSGVRTFGGCWAAALVLIHGLPDHGFQPMQ